MKYDHTIPALFIERPNRFIAYAKVNDKLVVCHVKNTGRCKELLLPGTSVILQHHPDAAKTKRKTEYSLIGVYKKTSNGVCLINMDSQAPNEAAWEWLKSSAASLAITNLCREVRFGSSRFDLAFHQKGRPVFMEVKGVTLEEEGIARFPDAPTERGIKHMLELERAVREGYESYILFVIQMKGIRYFEPNDRTHPAFGETLRQVRKSGVGILAWDCQVTEDEIRLDEPVEIRL